MPILLILGFVGVMGTAIYLATRPATGQPQQVAPPGPYNVTPSYTPKQPTMGPLSALLPPKINQPAIPANQAGQPVKSDPFAVYAATAPSLIAGAFGVYQESQKAAEAEKARTFAAQQAALARQGANPTAASPVLNSQPPQTMLQNSLQSNPDIANPAQLETQLAMNLVEIDRARTMAGLQPIYTQPETLPEPLPEQWGWDGYPIGTVYNPREDTFEAPQEEFFNW